MAGKEEGFEVVDKRRVAAETETQAESAAPPETAAQPEAPEEFEAGGEELGEAAEMLGSLDVYALLSSMIGVLHSFAWQKMGFVASRATGAVETDLPAAREAIDLAQGLIHRLEGRLPEPETRELRRMMMDLQMNYVRKSGG